METDIGDVVSIFYFFAKHVLQKVFARVTDSRPDFSFEAGFCGQNALFHLLEIRPIEWHLTAEELVSNDTKAPNIASIVARLIQKQLGCLVSECTRVMQETFVVL